MERKYHLVKANGRNIPTQDAIFGINMRAKEMIQDKGQDAVVNGTIGALLDDDGRLMVLDSVAKVYREIEPIDFAAYAPIGGTKEFKEALMKAAFGPFIPGEYGLFSEAVATPGGTGGIRNTISNYSQTGDKILTSDWHWSPYGNIAKEIGREIDVFECFVKNESGSYEFSVENLISKTGELLNNQDSLVVILNSPAHNPTGYSISNSMWQLIVDNFSRILDNEDNKNKSIALFVDVAYIDFAGDEVKYREFFKTFKTVNNRLLPIIGYSFSKTLTMYGMRCGGTICLTKDQEVATEFKQAMEFSSRATWSNSPRGPQTMVKKIYNDELLLAKIVEERKFIRDMLLERGKAFEERAKEIGLPMIPYDGGFFVSIPHENSKTVCEKLESEGIFLVPLAKGVRVSVASISANICRKLPDIIIKYM